MTVDGNPLEWNTQFVSVPGQRAPRPIAGVEVVFGGTQGDSTTPISPAAAGRFVVLLPNPNGPRGGQGQAFAVRGGAPARSRFDDAVAIATIDLDGLTLAPRVALNEPIVATSNTPGRGAPPGAASGSVDSIALRKGQIAALQPQAVIRLTRDAAARLFKRANIDGLAAGMKGGTVTPPLDFVELPTDWARNVVAVVPGSDPVLKHQFVAIGAHNDHVGITTPLDKDSIRAFNIE